MAESEGEKGKREKKIRTLRNRARRMRRRVLKRDGEICRYCGSNKNLTVDHQTPISRGGKSGIRNLAIVCLDCNKEKGAKTHEEFIKWREQRASLVELEITKGKKRGGSMVVQIIKKRRKKKAELHPDLVGMWRSEK